MLRCLRAAGGGLAAVALATAGTYFVAETTAGRSTPWWPYILLFGLAALGCLGYLLGNSDADAQLCVGTEGEAAHHDGRAAEQTGYFITEPSAPIAEAKVEGPGSAPWPVITDRWCHTSDGGKVPSLMAMTHTSVSHPRYGERPAQDARPSVKIGMLVSCQPIDLATSGTELRAKFLAFLASPAVQQLLEALTEIEPGMSWKNLAGHGPRTLEAALTLDEDPLQGVPVASALFLPPIAGESLYGRSGQAATLILYVEPRKANGQAAASSNLAAWHRRFCQALAVPGAFADFLATDLALPTCDEPSAQLGIWLDSHQHPLTAMIDIEGLRVLPGSWQSNQFMGWAFASDEGRAPSETARDLITQLCEYTLHLDGFEKELAEIKI